jgi:hypothetical protein
MTIRHLIDFYLSIQLPGDLLGFDSLYAEELEGLKQKIQDHYGSQESWLERDEDEELPMEITEVAEGLIQKYSVWKGDGNGRSG